MKIGEYEQMMAYLTRPGFNGGGSSEVVEIDFGSKEDQAFQDMLKAFKYYVKSGGTKSLKEYMRMSTKAGKSQLGGREHFRATGGRVNLSDGTEKIVEPPKSMQVDTTTSNPIPDYDITDFRNDAEIYVLMLHNNTIPKDDIAFKLNSFAQKGIDAGTFTMQEAADAVKDLKLYIKDRARQQRLRDIIPSGIGTIERENFYAGSSLEQYGSKIKKLYLEGTSSPKINEILGFENDRSSTIDNFIDSMKAGKSPVKITADELAKRPEIIGANQAGAAGQRLKNLQTYVEDFKKKNNRLPTMNELRKAKVDGKSFDYKATVKPAIDAGQIEVLDSSEARSLGGYKRTSEELLELSQDEKVKDIFRKGEASLKDLKTIKKVIGPVSDKVAGKRIIQLANIFANTEVEQARNLNITPKFKKNALKIIDNSLFSDYLRDAYEELIGKSVGEKSIKKVKADLRGSDLYKKGDLSKLYDIDELLGVSSSVTKGTTPYGIFGQVIQGGINRREKFQWDAQKSRLEENLQMAIREFGRGSKEANAARKEFNLKAKEAEDAINYGKAVGAKKVVIPKISFNTPKSSIANFDSFNATYKKAFNDNFKEKGYSFIIPKDVKTIPQLREGVKDKKSPVYKQMINSLKQSFNEFDEKKLFEKLKKATPESIKQNLKYVPRIASLEDDFTGPGGYPLTAGLDTSIGVKPVKDEDETFAERNPLVTGTGLTAGSALAVQNRAMGIPLLKALKNLGKYPIKALGSLPGSLYFAQDTIREGMDEGKSFLDAAIEPEVGLEFLYPEAVKLAGKAGPLMLKAARLSTPFGLGITALGTAKNIYERAQELKAMSPEERAALAQERDQFSFGEYSGAKDGGIMRTGFADGPEDPSKRKFMKIMGGLASLPIVGRFFDVAEKAAPAVTEVKEIIKNAPPHFIGLVNKIRALGKVVDSKTLLPSESNRYSKIYDYGEYRMFESKDGQIEISKENLMATDYGDGIVSEEYMSYNPKTPKINKKGEIEGYEDQYDEYTAYADEDGKMKDVQDGIEESTKDDGIYSKEELEQLIVEQIENDLKKGKK